MKIGIVGWGVEGQSVYKYFGPEHEYLIVNEEPRDDFPPESDKLKVQFLNRRRQPGLTGNVEDLSYLKGLNECDRIVYSPVAPKNLYKFYGNNKEFWDKAETVLHIFFESVKTTNLIGVTGTKGKGTTCALISKLLEAQGEKVFLGGNIGVSLLDFVKEVKPGDWVVSELSSFQLYNFPYSPHVAVCLMIVPEHMDWHENIHEYTDSKANLFRHQQKNDIAIYFADNELSRKIAEASIGEHVPYFKKPGACVRDDGMIVIGEEEKVIIDRSEVKLLGEHNLQNICAACTTVFKATGSLDNAKTVLSSFSGLEHRLEFVREFESVKYYDDSFGTTPDTAIVAMRAFKQPKVLILGGSDKGIAFDGLADEVANSNVKHVVLIGQTANDIARLLKNRGFEAISLGLDTMPEIVAEAQKHAAGGDVVLLSTGCASFGLFKDYKDRGNQFKRAVQALA